MKSEVVHLLLSLIVGIIFGIIGLNFSISILVAVSAGFFVDIDHLIDYLSFKKTNFDFSEFISGRHFDKSQKALLLFHSYEIVIILLIFYFVLSETLFLTLALALLAHLLFDILHNRTSLAAYSFVYRASKKFNSNALGCHNE